MAARSELDSAKIIRDLERSLAPRNVSVSANDGNFLYKFFRGREEEDPGKRAIVEGLSHKLDKQTRSGRATNKFGIQLDLAEKEYLAGVLSVEGRNIMNSQRVRVFCSSLRERVNTAFDQGEEAKISFKQRMVESAKRKVGLGKGSDKGSRSAIFDLRW